MSIVVQWWNACLSTSLTMICGICVLVEFWTPHLMVDKEINGTITYRGAVWTLINELGRILNFTLEVDLLLGPMEVNYERSLAFEFSNPIQVSPLVIVGKRPGSEKVIEGFLTPFSTWTWMTIVSMIIIVSFIELAVDKLYFRIHTKFQAYPEETDRKYGLIEYMWFNFRSTIYQGYPMKTENASLRFISSFWCTSMFIIMLSYCAVLRAHMTLTTIVAPIHNIHELANHPTILPSIQGLGSHETWLMVSAFQLHLLDFKVVDNYRNYTCSGASNSKQKDVKKIWQKVQSNKNGRIYDCFNSRTVVTELNGALLCEKETAIAMLSEDYHTTKNCHMYIIPEPIKTSVLAFMFNKNSSWITLINKQ
ncbi:Glutamate receptor 1 [Nymphon striatum]|nr:Glutamate receptor 1 [Nymphon striatum]